jgi:dihydrofolate reductase
MTAIRGFIGATLDGYIADQRGGIDFLKPYETVDYGFAGFFAEIGTCVFGRLTYEQTFAFGPDWPFAEKRVIVVASKPLARRPPNVEVWSAPVDAAFVAHLRAAAHGDVWIVGGGSLQSALFDLDAVDRLRSASCRCCSATACRSSRKAPDNTNWRSAASPSSPRGL